MNRVVLQEVGASDDAITLTIKEDWVFKTK